MKKISIMLLAALMLFAFVACDDKTPEVPAATAEEIDLVADYIDALEQSKVLGDFKTAAGGTESNGVKVTVDQSKTNVFTVVFTNYVNGTKNAQSPLKDKNVKLNGTVVLTLTKAENAAATSFDDATAYSIVVKDAKFTADQTTAVTLSLSAKGAIATGVIKYPAAADVTGLKVLFGETEKAASWADIYAKITK